MVAGLHDEMSGVNKRLDQGHARMCKIEDSISANHQASMADRERLEQKVDASNASIDELLEIIRMGKGFFKWSARIANFLRQAILWLLPVVTAVLAFWYLITGHNQK